MKPIKLKIPKNLDLTIFIDYIKIKGPFGTIYKKKPQKLKLYKTKQFLYFLNPNELTNSPLILSHLSKIFWGISKGVFKKLVLNGVGYRVANISDAVDLKLGFSHPIYFPIPKNSQIISPKNNILIVLGGNKTLILQTAADIRKLKLPEPYKGKGIRYINENIIRKVGKRN